MFSVGHAAVPACAWDDVRTRGREREAARRLERVMGFGLSDSGSSSSSSSRPNLEHAVGGVPGTAARVVSYLDFADVAALMRTSRRVKAWALEGLEAWARLESPANAGRQLTLDGDEEVEAAVAAVSRTWSSVMRHPLRLTVVRVTDDAMRAVARRASKLAELHLDASPSSRVTDAGVCRKCA